MIGAVHGASIAATATSSGSALRRFAQGVRWRHVLGRSCGSGLRVGLLLAVPMIMVAWLVPSAASAMLMIGAAVVLIAMAITAVRSWWYSRTLASAVLFSLKNSGDDIATLHDELLTWLEFDAQRHDDGGQRQSMLSWLEQDAEQRLLPHRRRALALVARPQLGRWRILLPIVLLLLITWLLAVWLAPPWGGAIGGRPDEPQASGQGGSDGAGGSGGANASSPLPQPTPGTQAKQDAPKDQVDEQSPDVQIPPEQLGSSQPDDPSDVPPLIDLPGDQNFVVPDFIGDGPTRRARMHAAELEEQAGGGASAAESRPTDSSGQDPNKPSMPDFERAAEAAQRSRHVPPVERAMVRRFFDKLRDSNPASGKVSSEAKNK